MGHVLPDGTAAPTTMLNRLAFDALSVAASGASNGATRDADWAKSARVVIPASGANVAVTLQGSVDGGATWYTIAAYAAGTTGAQPVLTLADPLVRLRAVNGATSAQSVTAHLTLSR